MALTHRLQVLLDEERYLRLEQLASSGGISIGSLVREAIDRSFPNAEINRRQAADAILNASPMPVDDWATMKGQMLAEMNGSNDLLAD